MKTWLSEEKLIKKSGTVLSKRTSPSLSTNPLFLGNFFITPLCPNFQKGGEGRETMPLSFIFFKP